jgi:hypothetical protein
MMTTRLKSFLQKTVPAPLKRLEAPRIMFIFIYLQPPGADGKRA